MRFEELLDGGPGENSGGALPDDLQQLAEQLSADAAHLASLYPAGPFSLAPAVAAESIEESAAEESIAATHLHNHSRCRALAGKHAKSLAAAAALLLAVGAWSLMPTARQPIAVETVQNTPLQNIEPVDHLSAKRHLSANRPPSIDGIDLTAIPLQESGVKVNVAPPQARPSTAPGVVIPPRIFQELTGAEQEALLDLMEQEELGDNSLSI